MRVLNQKQINKAPMVDAGNLYLGEMGAAEANRAIPQAQESRLAQARTAKQRKLAQFEARDEYMRGLANADYSAMLQRSLKQKDMSHIANHKDKTMGYVKQYGIHNPLMGFVNETTQPDYMEEQAIPAQEFSNRLVDKTDIRYSKFQDYPLVWDAKGDFGGILTNQAGSADFSTWIVNDANKDFGAIPTYRPMEARAGKSPFAGAMGNLGDADTDRGQQIMDQYYSAFQSRFPISMTEADLITKYGGSSFLDGLGLAANSAGMSASDTQTAMNALVSQGNGQIPSSYNAFFSALSGQATSVNLWSAAVYTAENSAGDIVTGLEQVGQTAINVGQTALSAVNVSRFLIWPAIALAVYLVWKNKDQIGKTVGSKISKHF